MLEPPKMFSDARHTSDVLEIESLAKLVYELDIQMDSNLFQTFETLVELAGTKQFLQTFSRFQYYLLNLKFMQNGGYGLGHSVPIQNNMYPLYQNVPMYSNQTPPSPTSPTQMPYPDATGMNVNGNVNGNVNANVNVNTNTTAAATVATGAPLNTTAIGGMAGNPGTPPYGALPTPEFYGYGGSSTPPELINTPPNYFPNQPGMIPSTSFPTQLDAATPYTNHLMGMAAAAPPPFEGMAASSTGVPMVSAATSPGEASLNPELSSSSSITLSSTTDMDIDYSSTSTTTVENKEIKKVESSITATTTTTTKDSRNDKSKETVTPSEKEVKEVETEKVDVVMTEKEKEDTIKKEAKIEDEAKKETSNSTPQKEVSTEVKETTTEVKESTTEKKEITTTSAEERKKEVVAATEATNTATVPATTTIATTTTTTNENTSVAVDGAVAKDTKIVEEKTGTAPVVMTEMDKAVFPNAEGLVGGFPIPLNTTMFPYDGSAEAAAMAHSGNMMKRPEMGMAEMAFHLTPPPTDGAAPAAAPNYPGQYYTGAGAPLNGQYYSGAGAPIYNRFGATAGEQVGVNGTAIPATGYYNSQHSRYEPMNYSSSYPGYNPQQPSYVHRHVFNNQTPLHKISLPQQQYHMVKKNSSGSSKSSMKMGEMNKVKGYGNKKHSSESKKNGVYQNLFM